MEIKRKTEIFIHAKRRVVIHPPKSAEQIFCPECAELMITAEDLATFLQVSRRSVYQLIEKGTAHFAETEAGLIFICQSSLPALTESIMEQSSENVSDI